MIFTDSDREPDADMTATIVPVIVSFIVREPDATDAVTEMLAIRAGSSAPDA